MLKRCAQTKLMDSIDIFNKHAVNCELSQGKIFYPYMAKHRPQQAVIRYDEPFPSAAGGTCAPQAVAAAAVTDHIMAESQTA